MFSVLVLRQLGDGVGPQQESSEVPIDWRLLFEQERTRAELAETRAEKLRRAKIRARSEAANAKNLLALSRGKHARFVEETNELRHTAKAVFAPTARRDQIPVSPAR